VQFVPALLALLFGERHGAHGFRQQGELLHMHGDLACARLEHEAFHAEIVAQVPQVNQRVAVALLVRFEVDLQFACAVHQVREGRLAHFADGDDAPCDGDRLPLQRLVAVVDLLQGVRGRVAFNSEGIQPLRAQLLEFLLANLHQLALFRSGMAALVVHGGNCT
jgi:hypothetical protein